MHIKVIIKKNFDKPLEVWQVNQELRNTFTPNMAKFVIRHDIDENIIISVNTRRGAESIATDIVKMFTKLNYEASIAD